MSDTKNTKTRNGFTTGSCAAAAAKAAAWMLLSGSEIYEVTIDTPKGIKYKAEIKNIKRTPESVSCAIVKDGGDDPDITTGTLIYAKVGFVKLPESNKPLTEEDKIDNRFLGNTGFENQNEKKENDGRRILIEGGKGVGRVTKPGLDQPVGEAAINSVPRKMITKEVLEVLDDFDYDGKTCDGFTKSIVPERTRLQTNFLIPSEKHTLVGGIVCVLHLAATLTAYPVLYYDGELNTHYADLIEPATLMGIIKLLESKGYDVRGMVKKLSGEGEEGSTDFFGMLSSISQTLEKYGTSLEEVMLIASDSGVEISDILAVYQYLTADPDPAEAKTRRVASASDTLVAGPMMIDYYQQYLTNWLNEETKDK